MRRTFISMTWTPGVASQDARLLIRQVEQTFDEIRPHLGVAGQFDPLPTVRVFGAWEIPSAPEFTAYNSVEWLVDRCVDDGGERILASRYMALIEREPWQASHPHFDLFLTDMPVCEDRSGIPHCDEVLGISRRGLVSLVSTSLLEDVWVLDKRKQALRHLYAHYIGQMFDVPHAGRADGVEEAGGGLYCTNTCAMRRTTTPDEALAFGEEQEAAGMNYCPDCQTDLVACITSYHYGVN